MHLKKIIKYIFILFILDILVIGLIKLYNIRVEQTKGQRPTSINILGN